MSMSNRPDEFSKYAPRWVREGLAKPNDAMCWSTAPHVRSFENAPWHGPSPFEDEFEDESEMQQAFDPPSSVNTSIPDSDELDVPPVSSFKRAADVSFALIAALTLALVMDDTLTKLSGASAEAAITAPDDTLVAQRTPTAPLATSVEYVVPGLGSPTPLETQEQSDPSQPGQPQTKQVPAQRLSERVLDPMEIAQLISRGEAFLAQGDVAAARLILERAAEAHDARAALLLGTTYDPDVLRRMGVVGIQPEPQRAQVWYAQAAEFGSREASQRLAGLTETAR